MMECPVCFEVYHNPLLLPGCGHTLCQACAEELITEENFLRCPECRLVYQLRQGIKSLPKNVALQRTIDEHTQNSSRLNLMCTEHPDDAVSLYCKTCEKSICLKCYFSNTLRRGTTLHTGHQVDTSEDAYSKEKRLLDERTHQFQSKRDSQTAYIKDLEETEIKLKALLDDKVVSVDKSRDVMLTQVKQTAGKLKFTLKGSVARDTEYLQMALESARERLTELEEAVTTAEGVMHKANRELTDISTIKGTRRNLEDLPSAEEKEQPAVETFLKIQHFNTDIEACLADPKMALSYQTEAPRVPTVSESDCIVSDNKALVVIHYSTQVRFSQMSLMYKEAMYKGLSEKEWDQCDVTQYSAGVASTVLSNLQKGTMYKVYAVATNQFGTSPKSAEVWFRTADGDIEIRTT